MKFTIGSISKFQEYEEELKLIKCSLLYADEIELIGLTEYIAHRFLPTMLNADKRIDALLKDLTSFLRSVEFPDKESTIIKLETFNEKMQPVIPVLSRKRHRSRHEILTQQRFNQLKNELKPLFDDTLKQFIDKPYAQELQMLIDKNIVSVFDYKANEINIKELMGGYVGNMMNAIYASHTYPLFDEESTRFISSISNAKLLNINTLNPEVLKHAGVAASILMTLPTLEDSSYDELLDFKKQNSTHLVRFRSAVYSFSEQISSLPWDNDFQYECLKLYNTVVAPQVEEINEIFTETTTLKNFGKKVFEDEEVRKKAGFAVGGLATAITTPNMLVELVNKVVMALGMMIFSGEMATGFFKAVDILNQSHSEVEEIRKPAIKNAMYYYYLAKTKIK